MRVMDDYLIVNVFFYFATLIGLLFGNIYIAVRLRRNIVSLGIHVTSLFTGIHLFCLYMQAVILELPFEKSYEILGKVAMMGALLAGAMTVGYLIYHKIRGSKPIFMNPDLSEIMSGMEDRVMIYDYNGILIETNQKPLGFELKEEVEFTIENLFKYIIELAAFALEDIQQGMPQEFEIAAEGRIYLLSSSLIRSNRKDHLGTIVCFHDITEEKTLLQELSKQNDLLQEANVELENYIKVANHLESEKVRLKLQEKINEELFIRIEEIIDKIRNLQKGKGKQECDQEMIRLISSELREIFQMIRASVRTIASDQ